MQSSTWPSRSAWKRRPRQRLPRVKIADTVSKCYSHVNTLHGGHVAVSDMTSNRRPPLYGVVRLLGRDLLRIVVARAQDTVIEARMPMVWTMVACLALILGSLKIYPFGLATAARLISGSGDRQGQQLRRSGVCDFSAASY
jgi:hypothetical protein